ncbi:hypothetical protein L2E82_37868 [Cichorium intybus]|uniref:Uncharacterized protein n=1 Tax=Cichorium intybus TaxID=13427 RepID=A0ACB9AEG6_CICIN|nr:hypothetical protein L2E82_37868 [Cichorium intybus]
MYKRERDEDAIDASDVDREFSHPPGGVDELTVSLQTSATDVHLEELGCAELVRYCRRKGVAGEEEGATGDGMAKLSDVGYQTLTNFWVFS